MIGLQSHTNFEVNRPSCSQDIPGGHPSNPSTTRPRCCLTLAQKNEMFCLVFEPSRVVVFMVECTLQYFLYCILTRALLGGGAFERPPPPSCFSMIAKKTAARSAAGFTPTLPPIFSATFVKISTQCHVRSGHQVRSSDPTTK